MLPKLQAGDLIYICSPAKAIEDKYIEFATSFFIKNGFRVEVSKNALGSNHYFSGTPEDRLHDFQIGLNHKEAKVILCARGGYGCMHLLDHLDWSDFTQHPKHIVGFSDVTAFHLELAKWQIPSLHATMPLNFQDNTAESLDSLLVALEGNPKLLSAKTHPNNQLGEGEGAVIGGNLALVHALLPRITKSYFENKLLFLEDVGEHLYQIDRMLLSLKYAGVLDTISGLIIGSFTSMSDTETPFGKSLEEIIQSHVSHLNIPVGFGFPCGHQNDNQTILIGGHSILKVNSSGSTLHQSFSKHPF